jgi:hypothetical protein
MTLEEIAKRLHEDGRPALAAEVWAHAQELKLLTSQLAEIQKKHEKGTPAPATSSTLDVRPKPEAPKAEAPVSAEKAEKPSRLAALLPKKAPKDE